MNFFHDPGIHQFFHFFLDCFVSFRCLPSFLLPDRWASLLDIQAMFRNASWEARSYRVASRKKTSKFCPSRVHSSLRLFLLGSPSTVKLAFLVCCSGLARIFLYPGLPIIFHCVGSGDLTTMEVHLAGSGMISVRIYPVNHKENLSKTSKHDTENEE
ncbi:hypothetical protein Tco_0016913 [Tanacetum coccineum]